MSQAAIEQDWDHVASLAADLHDAHARLVDFVARVLDNGTWQAAGLRSPEHWLMLRAGLSRGQATAVILLARRAEELPATSAALREGRISLDQAAVVARHTPADFDRTVAEFAQQATVTQLQRTVTRYDFTLEPASVDDQGEVRPGAQDPDAEPEVIPPATLSMGYADGRFRLRYDAPAATGALVEAALAEARDHLFHTTAGHDGERLDPDQDVTTGGRPRITWADALTLLATRSLDAATTGSGHDESHRGDSRRPGSSSSGGAARRARYRVQVHLDTEGGWLNGQPRLPRHIVDGLTCDGTLIPVWETRGHPVNVGDTQRVVPQRTRVLVLDRDRGCRFPGCGSTRHLEVHHLIHWRHGGLTDLDNLLGLCPFHHDGHHRGEFTITGDPTRADGLTFLTAHGLLIGPPHRPPLPPPVQAHPGQAQPVHAPPDEQRHRASGLAVTCPDITVATGTDSSTTPSTGADGGSGGKAGIVAPSPTRPRARPASRLGQHYAAPTGGTLRLHLVDFTPT